MLYSLLFNTLSKLTNVDLNSKYHLKLSLNELIMPVVNNKKSLLNSLLDLFSGCLPLPSVTVDTTSTPPRQPPSTPQPPRNSMARTAASPPVATPAKQAERLREDGNLYFKKQRFAAAIEAYTEAITLCPNVPIYWTNRALCHRRRNDWTRVEEDCRRAIQLDNHSVKAHYMLGLALLQKQEYKDGVKELEKALDLGRCGHLKGCTMEEIWQELAKAKYLEWEQESSQRSWDFQTLKINCEEALKEKHALDASKKEGFVDEADVAFAKQLEGLEQVFERAAECDTPSEVPDYLCCKITLDIFRDPVIGPSGFTYERSVILDHLEKVGKFDPITREPLRPSQLTPNFAIKEAVRDYLDKHGWAYRLDSI